MSASNSTRPPPAGNGATGQTGAPSPPATQTGKQGVVRRGAFDPITPENAGFYLEQGAHLEAPKNLNAPKPGFLFVGDKQVKDLTDAEWNACVGEGDGGYPLDEKHFEFSKVHGMFMRHRSPIADPPFFGNLAKLRNAVVVSMDEAGTMSFFGSIDKNANVWSGQDQTDGKPCPPSVQVSFGTDPNTPNIKIQFRKPDGAKIAFTSYAHGFGRSEEFGFESVDLHVRHSTETDEGPFAIDKVIETIETAVGDEAVEPLKKYHADKQLLQVGVTLKGAEERDFEDAEAEHRFAMQGFRPTWSGIDQADLRDIHRKMITGELEPWERAVKDLHASCALTIYSFLAPGKAAERKTVKEKLRRAADSGKAGKAEKAKKGDKTAETVDVEMAGAPSEGGEPAKDQNVEKSEASSSAPAPPAPAPAELKPFHKYFFAACELASRHGLYWYYRLEGVKQYRSLGADDKSKEGQDQGKGKGKAKVDEHTPLTVENALEHHDYPFPAVHPPRWLWLSVKVYVHNQSGELKVTPSCWAEYREQTEWANAESRQFANKAYILRDRDYQANRLQRLRETTDTTRPSAQFERSDRPGCQQYWKVTIRFPGDGVPEDKSRVVGAISPDPDTRLEVTYVYNGVTFLFDAVVFDAEPVDGTDQVVVAAHGDHPGMPAHKPDQWVPVDVEWKSSPVSSRREYDALTNIYRGQERKFGIDIPQFVLGAERRTQGHQHPIQEIGGKLDVYRAVIQNHGLNEMQRKAALELLDPNNDSGCMVEWGPPGTGKTKTSAAIVDAMVTIGRKVIVAGPSNKSVDEGLTKLLRHHQGSGRTKPPKIDLKRVVRFKGASFEKSGQLSVGVSEEEKRTLQDKRTLEDMRTLGAASHIHDAQVALWDQIADTFDPNEGELGEFAYHKRKLQWMIDLVTNPINPMARNKAQLEKARARAKELLGVKGALEDEGTLRHMTRAEINYAKEQKNELEFETAEDFAKFGIDIVYVTCNSASHMALESFVPKTAVIEEGGLAKVGDLACVLAPFKETVDAVVLTGDWLQNRPYVSSESTNEWCGVGSRSFFEEIAKDTYRPVAKRVVRLDEQYRIHERIGRPFFDIFYGREVYASGKAVRSHPSVNAETPLDRTFKAFCRKSSTRYTDQRYIAVDVSTDANSERYKDTTSQFNEKESEAVKTFLGTLLNMPPVKEGVPITEANVAVIVPYTGQAKSIKMRLHSISVKWRVFASWSDLADEQAAAQEITADARGVPCMTTTRVQGGEFDLVVLSLTSNIDAKPKGNPLPLGWIKDPCQLCVEYSRARRGLIVFGNWLHWGHVMKSPQSPAYNRMTDFKDYVRFKQVVEWTLGLDGRTENQPLVISEKEFANWMSGEVQTPDIGFDKLLASLKPLPSSGLLKRQKVADITRELNKIDLRAHKKAKKAAEEEAKGSGGEESENDKSNPDEEMGDGPDPNAQDIGGDDDPSQMDAEPTGPVDAPAGPVDAPAGAGAGDQGAGGGPAAEKPARKGRKKNKGTRK